MEMCRVSSLEAGSAEFSLHSPNPSDLLTYLLFFYRVRKIIFEIVNY